MDCSDRRYSRDRRSPARGNHLGRVRKRRVGWGTRIRTWECRYQKPMPYHLAMPQPAPRDAERAKYPTPSGYATGQCGRYTDEMHKRLHVPWRGNEKSADKHALGALRGCEELAISRASVRSVAQPGRALSSGGRGREFESRHSDHLYPCPANHLSKLRIAPTGAVALTPARNTGSVLACTGI